MLIHGHEKFVPMKGFTLFPIVPWISYVMCGDYRQKREEARTVWQTVKEKMHAEADQIVQGSIFESTVPGVLRKILERVDGDATRKKELLANLARFPDDMKIAGRYHF